MGKRCLFFLTTSFLEVRLLGDWGSLDEQRTLSFEVPGALPTAIEKPKDRFICTSCRAHDPIRTPRLASVHSLLDKGSRERRSVT